MPKHTKVAQINLRVTHEFKARAARLAAEEHRSLVSFFEWLVLEHEKRKSKKGPEPPAG